MRQFGQAVRLALDLPLGCSDVGYHARVVWLVVKDWLEAYLRNDQSALTAGPPP